MNIQSVGWLDTSLVWMRLRLSYWDRFEGDGDLETLHLLDDEGEELPILKGEKGWKGVGTFLTKLSNAAAPFLNNRPAEFAGVWLDRLKPNGKTNWGQTDEPDLLRVHICLAGPPNALFYCGGEAAVLGVGVVNYINVGALHSRVNFGNAPAIHMVANVRRPAPQD